jgi:hypothetical protein
MGGYYGMASLLSSIMQPIFGPIIGRQQANLQLKDFIEQYPQLNNVMTTFAPPTGVRAVYDKDTGEVKYEAPLLSQEEMLGLSGYRGPVGVNGTMMSRLNQREKYTAPPETKGNISSDLKSLFS